MILIDTVYQRVLAAVNKEQRGYITPQEFNLFANQAQLDIFDQYFYDVDKFSRVHGNETEASDMLDLLNEKIDIFEMINVPLTVTAGVATLPMSPANADIYILGNIIYTNTQGKEMEVERVSHKEFTYIQNAPLASPRNDRPIYISQGKNVSGNRQIVVFGNSAVGGPTPITIGLSCSYIRRPLKVDWGFAVVNGYAQYDSTNSTDFELHLSEENNLVIKILELAGIQIKDANLYQIASQEEIKDIQQEKQ
jgi:hypothetical protein